VSAVCSGIFDGEAVVLDERGASAIAEEIMSFADLNDLHCQVGRSAAPTALLHSELRPRSISRK
jgi:hypothetical protein